LSNQQVVVTIIEGLKVAENLFKPLKRARLYEEIVDHIKGLIIEGKLKPSDKLPSERELACQFNVGRPTVREAIRTLSLMGLVEVNAGQRGTLIKNFALDPYMESVREQMSWLIQMERSTLQQLLEVRDTLETRIALLAAERATQKDLKELSGLLEDMESYMDHKDTYLEKAIEFHKVMALSTKNHIFYTIWNAFSDLIFKYYGHLLEGVSKKILKKLYLANKGAYQAILAKDQEAIRLAMAHHVDVEREILWTNQGKSS
jgi:GntR family transcriptional repressor for pyruvate dehydrogenase complex